MIVAFSTSSPIASAALISAQGDLLGAGSRDAPMAAGASVLELLQSLLAECSARLEDASLFVCDVGPGSFTGVRVGVTLAKSFGYRFGKPCGSVSAFDLIDAATAVAIPARKGSWYLRFPGSLPMLAAELPTQGCVGYGEGFETQRFPEASLAADLLSQIETTPPFELLASYLAEPSISQPKKPYAKSFGASAGA